LIGVASGFQPVATVSDLQFIGLSQKRTDQHALNHQEAEWQNDL
jgi:hypothetical protein